MDSLAPNDSQKHEAAPIGKRRGLRRFVLPWLLILVALAALTIVATGNMRVSTGPASGEGCLGTLPTLSPDKATFRIGTLNMHGGVGEDDVYNLRRTIEAIRDTDFCALNEVRGRLTGDPRNQAQELAEATNHAWLYLPSERRFWHDDFGNGLITRLPVEEWVRTPLPTEPQHGGLRNATVVRVAFGSQIVQFLLTHIDRSRDQSNQLRMITRLYDSLAEPSVLLGDLNADSNNPDVRALLARPGVHDCIAEATGNARDRIDWILARGLKARGGGIIKNGASDHPMYWVDLAPNP
ncbi:MAG TPA: endonuclease/exonuclease/phosphatase family protein [Tepidisphaeraceae bacterium]|jgi:endonuclease/exonuclease/phosphatase family metal-dependent hydrolase